MTPSLVLLFVLQAAAPNPMFHYDDTRPLSFRSLRVDTVGRAQVQDVRYESPKGGAVPSYLVAPLTPRNGSRAGIVFVHWGQGNRTEFVSEAVRLADDGVVSLLIDAPYWRPELRNRQGGDAARERDQYIQLVVDVRRAFDVLVDQAKVDSRRLGYVGHSLGATWGGVIAAVDPRPKVLVLMGGLPTLTDYDDSSFYGEINRESTPRPKFDAWARVIEPINPIHFVGGSSPRLLYFQWARFDMYITRAAAAKYFAAAGKPKVERWYDTSHEFNDTASREDRLRWLRAALGLDGR